TPFILPQTRTHHEFGRGYLGSRLALDTSTMVLSRREGAESRRAMMMGSYHLPVVTTGGHLLEFTTRLRGDVYSVDDAPIQGGMGQESSTTGRFLPEFEAQWSYPLQRPLENGNLLVEPIVSLIAAPNGGNPDEISNEDSQNFELNT